MDVLGKKCSGGLLEKLLVKKVNQHSNDGPKGAKPALRAFCRQATGERGCPEAHRNNAFDACGANIAAGSDTTRISLGAALYYLFENPDKLVKPRQKIHHGQAAGEVSDPVTFQESQRMPYLQAVIKEALRLHPAVGTILARDVPEGGAYLAGQYFPGVGANAWVLHYDSQIYGPDPYSLRPERCIELDDGPKSLKESMFFPFGAGSRSCISIGKNISLLEMSEVIPQIVRDFDFEFEHLDQPWEVFCSWFVYQRYLA